MSGRVEYRYSTVIAEDCRHRKQNPAPCADCGKHTEPYTSDGRPLFKRWDQYLVRDEVWREAGMDSWGSGYLCTPCLRKRLGRELIAGDFTAETVEATNKGLDVGSTPITM